MRTSFLRFATVLAIFAAFSLSAPEVDAYDGYETFEDEEMQHSGPFSPGSLDFTLRMGGILYNTVEPGVDLGLIPIGDGMTLSVGGSVDAGYCLIGCALFNFLLNPLRLNAWHINPLARVILHFNMISEIFDVPSMNIYAGLTGGPSFYNVSLTIDGDDSARANYNQTTFVIGPMAGLRYTFKGTDGFFVFVEGRFLIEAGARTYTVTDSAGNEYSEAGWVNRGGSSTGFGLGFRF